VLVVTLFVPLQSSDNLSGFFFKVKFATVTYLKLLTTKICCISTVDAEDAAHWMRP